MTSLKDQLAQLRGDNAVAAAGNKSKKQKGKASFLFHPREAEDVDTETICGLGINGLMELTQLNPRFAIFEASLFSVSSSYDRDLLTKAENEALNEALADFLRQLSPFFLLKPAHKALEFLIRLYAIHRYNTEEIMACVLPYHETPYFPRIVKLLQLKNSRWAFLHAVQESGSPLARNALSERCIRDSSVLQFICDLVKTQPENQKALTLYTLVAMEVLARAPQVSDDLLRLLLPAAFDGIKATAETSRERQLSAFMVIVRLSQRLTLTAHAVVPLVNAVARQTHSSNAFESFCCLLSLFQTQEELSVVPPKAFRYLCKVPAPGLSALVCQAISEPFGYDTSRFLELFLDRLAEELTEGSMAEEGREKRGGEGNEGASSPPFRSVVRRFLLDVPLEEQAVGFIKKLLFRARDLLLSLDNGNQREKEVHKARENGDSVEGKLQTLGEALKMVSSRYPEAVDKALSILNDLDSVFPAMKGRGDKGSGMRTVSDFLRFIYGTNSLKRESQRGDRDAGSFARYLPLSVSTGSQWITTTLLLALEHPSPAVRVAGLREIEALGVEDEEKRWTEGEVLLRRLEVEEDISVVKQLIDSPSLSFLLLLLNDPEVILHVLLRALRRWSAVLVKEDMRMDPYSVQVVVERLFFLLFDKLLSSSSPQPYKTSVLAFLLEALPLPREVNKVERATGGLSSTRGRAILGRLAVEAATRFPHPFLAGLGEALKEKEQEDVEEETLLSRQGERLLRAMAGNLKRLGEGAISLYRDLHTEMRDAMLEAKLPLLYCLREYARTASSERFEVSEDVAELQKELFKCLLNWWRVIENSEASSAKSGTRSTALVLTAEAIVSLLQSSALSLSSRQAETSKQAQAKDNFAESPKFEALVLFLLCNDEDAISVRNSLQSLLSSSFKSTEEALSALLKVCTMKRKHISALSSFALSSPSVAVVRAALLLRSLLAASRRLPKAQLSVVQKEVESRALSLLVPLLAEEDAVRSCAIDCIAAARELLVSSSSTSAKSLGDFFLFLGNHRAELMASEKFLPDALRRYGGEGERKKQEKAENKELIALYALLWGVVERFVEEKNFSAAKVILQLLHGRRGEKTEAAKGQDVPLPLLQSLLAQQEEGQRVQAKEKREELEEVSSLVQLLLGCVLAGGSKDRALSSSSSSTAAFFSLILRILAPGNGEGEHGKEKPLRFSPLRHLVLDSLSGYGGRQWIMGLAMEKQQELLAALLETVRAGEAGVEVEKAQKCLLSFPLSSSFLSQQLSAATASSQEQWVEKCTAMFEVLSQKIERGDRDTEREDLREELVKEAFSCLKAVLKFYGHEEYAKQLLLHTIQLLVQKNEEESSAAVCSHVSSNDVSAVVELLETSDTPQTRNAALLLLAALAPHRQKEVLEGVLPLLTGSQSSESRRRLLPTQDDSYSFQVIRQVIARILPLLAGGSGVDEAVKEKERHKLLVSLLSQVRDVPAHRRLPLLDSVVRTLQPSSCLHVAVAVLLQAKIQDPASSESSYLQYDELAHSLCYRFAAPVQVSSVVGILTIFKKISMQLSQKLGDDVTDIGEDEEAALAEQLLGKELDVPEKQKLVMELVTWCQSHLESKALHHQLLTLTEKGEEADAVSLQREYLRLAQTLLLSIRLLSRCEAVESSTGATGIWKCLTERAFLTLETLQRLLSVPAFLAMITDLLQSEDSQIRRKALTLLNGKVESSKDHLSKEEVKLFLDMVPGLEEILREKDEQSTINLQTSLLSLDVLARAFGEKHPAAFVKVLPAIVGCVDVDSVSLLSPAVAAEKRDKIGRSKKEVEEETKEERKGQEERLQFVGTAYLCLSTLSAKLGPRLFPHLPKFFPKLMELLEFASGSVPLASPPSASMGGKRQREGRGEEVKFSAVSSSRLVLLRSLLMTVAEVSRHLPQFLPPYLRRLLACLLSPELLSIPSLSPHITAALSSLSQGIEVRHLIPALTNVYGTLTRRRSEKHGNQENHEPSSERRTKQGEEAAYGPSSARLFSLMGSVISVLTKPELQTHFKPLVGFFVAAFDHSRRSANLQISAEQVQSSEDAMIEAFLSFILKLNERQLKPFFLKLIEWMRAPLKQGMLTAETGGGDIHRRITFFRALLSLVKRLKSIIVPYFAFIIDDIVSCLTCTVRPQAAERGPEASDNSEAENGNDFFLMNGKEEGEREEPKSKKRRYMSTGKDLQRKEGSEREELVLLLQSTILRALQECFLHDTGAAQGGFIDRERFQVLLSPLLSQLDVAALCDTQDGGEEEREKIRTHVQENVVPCLARFVASVGEDAAWKPFHFSLLGKGRGENARIRWASLLSLRECYRVVGEEFLSLLPESIPFLAEMLEDDDDEVERLTRKVIEEIEELSGEKLDQYME